MVDISGLKKEEVESICKSLCRRCGYSDGFFTFFSNGIIVCTSRTDMLYSSALCLCAHAPTKKIAARHLIANHFLDVQHLGISMNVWQRMHSNDVARLRSFSSQSAFARLMLDSIQAMPDQRLYSIDCFTGNIFHFVLDSSTTAEELLIEEELNSNQLLS